MGMSNSPVITQLDCVIHEATAMPWIARLSRAMTDRVVGATP